MDSAQTKTLTLKINTRALRLHAGRNWRPTAEEQQSGSIARGALEVSSKKHTAISAAPPVPWNSESIPLAVGEAVCHYAASCGV